MGSNCGAAARKTDFGGGCRIGGWTVKNNALGLAEACFTDSHLTVMPSCIMPEEAFSCPHWTSFCTTEISGVEQTQVTRHRRPGRSLHTRAGLRVHPVMAAKCIWAYIMYGAQVLGARVGGNPSLRNPESCIAMMLAYMTSCFVIDT